MSPAASQKDQPREQHLRAIAARLAKLYAVEPRIDVGLLGVIAGAVYALRMAISLDYDDQRGRTPDLDTFASEFRDTLERLSRGEEPSRAWQAGFHFVSALFRLAALIDRLGREHFGPWPDDEARGRVRADVNRIKHGHMGYLAHPATKLETRLDDAVDVADAIRQRLEGNLTAAIE